MVLDIIGENHRTRYGIKEEFHMTEECAMWGGRGIRKQAVEETRSVLEYFFPSG